MPLALLCFHAVSVTYKLILMKIVNVGTCWRWPPTLIMSMMHHKNMVFGDSVLYGYQDLFKVSEFSFNGNLLVITA